MPNQAGEALGQLKGYIPQLVLVKTMLQQMVKRFSPISYYKKFIYGKNPPSLIPIEAIEEFWTGLSSAQKSLLEFRSLFNENDLPENIRPTFVSISVDLLQNKFDLDNEVVKIGGIGGAWWKDVPYVLKNWNPMKYKVKVMYSQEAYENISYYFKLIGLIEGLEAKM